MNFIDTVKRITPPFLEIRKDIELLKLSNPGMAPKDLSRQYRKKIRNKYTSVGVATSLPGMIPGVGTAAQLVFEAGSVSADVALMLRWMATLCYGTAYIYARDIEQEFESEFTTVLGLWAGIITPEEITAAKSSSITSGHFDKHMADRIKNRMNQKIWRKLATKYGIKRSGLIGGKLIPFGIGAVIGGSFNYATMQRFGNAADGYFKNIA